MATPVIPTTFACRPLYSDGMFLTSGIMAEEQNYFINWITLQTQLMYTGGILTGLTCSAAGGNTVMVSTGAGLDEGGNFLIVPSGGITYTVPKTQASPSYIYLFMPTPPPTPSPSVTTFNAAAQLGLSTGTPLAGLVVGQVTLDNNGVVTSVISISSQVRSRLTGASTSPPALMTDAMTAGVSANSLPLEGNVSVAGSALATAGQSVTRTVTFRPDGIAAFTGPPRVFITALGSRPLATSVAAITTSQFALTVAAVATATDAEVAEPVSLHWLALL